MYSSFVILDLETTGVDPETGDIIEFAAVKVDQTGKIVDQLDILIGTDQEVNTFVRALTGIAQQDLVGKPKISEVMSQIVGFIGDSPIVGHNISFDVDFLNGKGADLKNQLLDTVELSQTVLPRQDGYSLEYLTYHFNFPHKSSHRAMDDVMATLDLFYLLIGKIAELPGPTRQSVLEVLKGTDWSWLWLFEEADNFAVPRFDERGNEVTEKLISEIDRAQKNYLPKLPPAGETGVSLIETHFAVDSLALALSFAIKQKPSILCLSTTNLKLADWSALSKKFSTSIQPIDLAGLSYREASEIELAKNLPSLSALEARLIAKTIIWKQVWGKDYAKLFLSSDERYQWEQKLSHGPSEALTTIENSGAEVVVLPAHSLLGIGPIPGRHLVITDPLILEDAAFHSSGKTFSVPYFNALVSSRRDFVHLTIRERDPKLADQLFKILNEVGGALSDITKEFVAVFAQFPPTNPFDRNLELSTGHMNETLRASLSKIARDLSDYLERVRTAEIEDSKNQVESTERLLKYLNALINLDPEFRYFLWADGHRFFLELVPREPSFGSLGDITKAAQGVTVLGAGLSYTGRFDYWQAAFPGSEGQIVPGDLRAEINVLGSLADDDNYFHDLIKVAGSFIEKVPHSLILGGTGFDANQLLIHLFDSASQKGVAIHNHETLKTAENLSSHFSDSPHATVIGYYWWLEKARFHISPVAEVLMAKIPFEASSRPQSKVMQGEMGGFEAYTLPRTVMKFKEVLHQAILTQKPITLADSRLFRKDYGRKVINSCPGVTFIPS